MIAEEEDAPKVARVARVARLDIMPPPTIAGVLETSLYAADLAAAAHFYGTILGLPQIRVRRGAASSSGAVRCRADIRPAHHGESADDRERRPHSAARRAQGRAHRAGGPRD